MVRLSPAAGGALWANPGSPDYRDEQQRQR